MASIEIENYGPQLDRQRILITSSYQEKDLVSQVPGTRWDGDRKVWTAPLTWAACLQFRGIFGVELGVGPALSQWSREEFERRIAPSMQWRDAMDANLEGFVTAHERMYPFQRAGVGFLLTAKNALMADEMGTGKTVMGTTALEAVAAPYPALVVCPNNMLFTWKNHLQTWNPEARPVVITGTKPKREKALAALIDGEANVGIINWEAVRLHSRLAPFGDIHLTDEEKTPGVLNEIGFRAVIADEAHRGKDPRSKQTRALWAVGHGPTVVYRWALTGTPLADHVGDLWAIMHFVEPNEYPTKTKFIDRYAQQQWNYFGFMDIVGVKAEVRDEMYAFLDPRMIRRPKELVLPNLPKKVYTTRHIPISGKQHTAYKKMEKDMVAVLDLKGKDDTAVTAAPNVLTQLIRLLQFASASGEIVERFEVVEKIVPGADDAETIFKHVSWHETEEEAAFAALELNKLDGRTFEYRRGEQILLTDPSNKVDALEEIADELGGKSAVVFAESKQLIYLAHRRLTRDDKTHTPYKVGLITGDQSPEEREQSVADFQRGELQFLLITMGAGGEGYTLTAADTAIFLQRSWSAIKNAQAEDRLHRPGAEIHESIQIIDLVSEDTADAVVLATMLDKKARLQEVVRDKETLRRWLLR